MNCPSCGLVLLNGTFCVYHTHRWEHWAAMNRAFCDMVHRGRESEPLPGADEQNEAIQLSIQLDDAAQRQAAQPSEYSDG